MNKSFVCDLKCYYLCDQRMHLDDTSNSGGPPSCCPVVTVTARLVSGPFNTRVYTRLSTASFP